MLRELEEYETAGRNWTLAELQDAAERYRQEHIAKGYEESTTQHRAYQVTRFLRWLIEEDKLEGPRR